MSKRAAAGATGQGLVPPPAVPPVPSVPTDSPPRRSRLFLIVAAVLAAGWGVTLALLAFFTANPVTLNREQIQASPYVVTGTVEGDPSQGRVAVEREWKHNALAGTIVVENLKAAGARQGMAYIIPLSRPDHALRVTEAPYLNGTPLIDPATPEALKQLKAILEHLPNDALAK